jgi:putative toxin-antitoxin system antitoxin component (TIGR02293 family)
MGKLVRKLGTSEAPLHRREAQGRLGKGKSDTVVRHARLMSKAIAVFENEEEARLWLASPQFGLGGAVPLGYAETEAGAREVDDLLGRIEFGVYS